MRCFYIATSLLFFLAVLFMHFHPILLFCAGRRVSFHIFKWMLCVCVCKCTVVLYSDFVFFSCYITMIFSRVAYEFKRFSLSIIFGCACNGSQKNIHMYMWNISSWLFHVINRCVNVWFHLSLPFLSRKLAQAAHFLYRSRFFLIFILPDYNFFLSRFFLISVSYSVCVCI